MSALLAGRPSPRGRGVGGPAPTGRRRAGLLAEVERDLISERTKAGLARARAEGTRLGRPKGVLGKSRLDGREAEIKAMLAKRVSKASLARILDVSPPTLSRFITSRKIAL